MFSGPLGLGHFSENCSTKKEPAASTFCSGDFWVFY